MLEAAVVEVLDDSASDLCVGTLWLSPDLVLIVTATGFAELCRLVHRRLAELVDEADRHHEDWRTSRAILRYRGIPLMFVDTGRSPPPSAPSRQPAHS